VVSEAVGGDVAAVVAMTVALAAASTIPADAARSDLLTAWELR
jgi:hypothetical protein